LVIMETVLGARFMLSRRKFRKADSSRGATRGAAYREAKYCGGNGGVAADLQAAHGLGAFPV
jgi:hypothetical protein